MGTFDTHTSRYMYNQHTSEMNHEKTSKKGKHPMTTVKTVEAEPPDSVSLKTHDRNHKTQNWVEIEY